jgi:hypothetical protein
VRGAAGYSSYAPRSGGWVRGAREGGRVGSTKAVVGQVLLGGGEMSSGRSKNGFVFDFLFAFGRLVGDNERLVCWCVK